MRPPLRSSLRWRPAHLRAGPKRRIFAAPPCPHPPVLRASREVLGLNASFEYLGRAPLEVAARGRQRVATVGQLAIVVREVSVHLDAGALQRPRSASAASGVVLLTSYPLTVAAAARLPPRWAPSAALTTRPSRAATATFPAFCRCLTPVTRFAYWHRASPASTSGRTECCGYRSTRPSILETAVGRCSTSRGASSALP